MQSPTNATTATMKALRLEHWQSPAVLRVVDRPEPGPGEVLVQVGGAGACHSDLHLMHEFGEGQPPGHPRSRSATRTPAGCTRWATGSPASSWASRSPWSAPGAAAPASAAGRTWRPTATIPSAPAHRAAVAASGSTAGWPSSCSSRTPATSSRSPTGSTRSTRRRSPTRRSRRTTPCVARGASWPRPTAVVIGVGGLGHLGIQVLHATTAARIIAVDPRESARDLAKRSGADLVLAPGATPSQRVREATGGIGADVVLDFVGADETLPLGRRDGAPARRPHPRRPRRRHAAGVVLLPALRGQRPVDLLGQPPRAGRGARPRRPRAAHTPRCGSSGSRRP